MKLNKLFALALACGISATAYAADTYDMGNVQVVGKDAQHSSIKQSLHDLAFGMTEKSIPLPDLIPEMESLEYNPMSEKPTLDNIHRENKQEFSAALGLGNRSSSELLLNGKGKSKNYDTDIYIIRQVRDGFMSDVDSKKTGVFAKISGETENASSLSAGFTILDSENALRGTRNTIKAGKDANAKFKDDVKRIWVKGDKTLENGAFAKGYLSLDAINRDTSNKAGFKDDEKLKSFRIGGNYKNRVDDKTMVNAKLDIKRDKLDADLGNSISFTKTMGAAGVSREFTNKSEAGIGLKAIKLKGKNSFSPYFNYDYKPDDAWKISLGYEEDLGNDNLERIFLPHNRYVDTLDFEFKPSKKRTIKLALDYKTDNGHSVGLDLFKQKEDDAITYYDMEDFRGQRLLSSRIAYANAERKGISLRGDFKLNDYFTLNIKATAQDPKNRNGGKLSYEAKQILDVGLNFTKDKWMVDITRRAENDRKALIGTWGGAIAEHGISDYTRSDLAVRYKFSEKFTGYVKIKDLYDEGKRIRSDVAEEGRVTMGGIEMHF